MISYISLIFYMFAFIHIVLFLFWGSNNFRNFFNIFMGLGLIFNIADLFLRFMQVGGIQASTLYDLMVVVSLSLAITYFILFGIYKRPLIGMFISPIMVIIGIVAILFPPTIMPSYPVVDSIWRYVHLPFTVIGSTFLVAAFVSSIMYIIQEAQLKKKKFGFIFQRFPALDTIGKINDTSLKLGFYFFTAGSMLGFVWMLQNNLEEILSSAKIIFSILTWLVFAIIIVLKDRKPLTQRQTARLTVFGFILLIITYVGVANFMLR